MKIQTGVDIIEVERIKEAIQRQGETFLKSVYTQGEIAYCENTNAMKYQHYAARFAAKEAVYKAISFKISENEDNIFNKIEVKNEKSGKPTVNLEKLKISGIIDMDLSLSHLKDYAVASFTVLFEN